MNYFEFYELPVSFILNPEDVKRKYLELSKKYHPDFFVNEEEAEQHKMLELATYNTKAYEVLSDFDRRMKYLLEIRNQVTEGERYELSPDFLMDMMEINENLMELHSEPDVAKAAALKLQVRRLFDNLYADIRDVLETYKDDDSGTTAWQRIKDYYYRKKYLLRIQQSLDTFTPHA